MKKRILAFVCVVALLIPMLLSCDMFDERESTTPEEEITPAESTTPEESTTPGENTIPGETTTPEVVTTAPPPIETTTPERVTVAPPPDTINPPLIIPNVDMSQIYEVFTGLSGGGHENIIENVKSLGVEDGISDKTIQLDGKEYYLKYQDSYYNLYRDGVVERYFVGDDSKKEVWFDKDGNIVSICFDFKKLNITDQTTPMELVDILKEEFEETYHLSSYQYVYVPRVPTVSSAFCGFTFYNVNNGFVTDTLDIGVKRDGTVSALHYTKCPVADAEFEIDPKLEDAVIDLKLRKTYADKGYCWYEFMSGKGQNEEYRYLVRYNGKLYALYGTGAKLYEKQTGEIYSSYGTIIMIPIDMISKK